MILKRPNILAIMTDQQRFDTVAALGNPIIQTPALDLWSGRVPALPLLIVPHRYVLLLVVVFCWESIPIELDPPPTRPCLKIVPR